MIFDNVTHQFDDKFGRGARIINFSFSSELVTANTHPTRLEIALPSIADLFLLSTAWITEK